MLRPFDVKAPLVGISGAGEKAEAGNLKAHPTPHCATDDLLAVHFCCCRHGVHCIFCLRWHRTITGIEQRRADSLRRQALGRRVAGGL